VSLLSNLFHKGSESESTSLSEQFTSLEWIEATRDAAIQLWRASMLSMSEAMPLVPKQISEPHRKSLKQLVDEMPNKPAPNVIEQRKQKTAEILKSYGAQMGSFIDSQDKEAKAVLNSVAQLTDTLSGFDQRYAVKFQGITKKLRLLATCNDLGEIRTKLSAEVTQLEKTLEEQQRDTRSAVQRLGEDVSRSEVRKQRAIPGPGSQHASDSLLTLDRAVSGWDLYCLVRYEFQPRPGVILDAKLWETKQGPLLEALPERLGHPVRVVVPKPGVLLAAVHCQLLEYAGQAESMERSLAQVTGMVCASRVVEPLRGEVMREAMVRLEKAG
jgi:hypothetical protein